MRFSVTPTGMRFEVETDTFLPLVAASVLIIALSAGTLWLWRTTSRPSSPPGGRCA